MSITPRFVALEGIDGSGTTTQLDRLCEALSQRGVGCTPTREPSTGPVGRFIRDVLTGRDRCTKEALALAFAADRLDHLQREIEPALSRGQWVITDRYLLSSLAYQSLEVPLDWVRQINQHARAPDLTFFLRLPPEVAAQRRQQRGQAQERFEQEAFQQRVAARYEEVLEMGGGPVKVIDASLSVDAITDLLLQGLAEWLP